MSGEQESAGDKQDDYHDVHIEVTEQHLESLKHGSGVTYEFDYDDGTLAVHVDSERELDKDWLLGQQLDTSASPGLRWRVVAGLTAAMVGMLWAAAPPVDFYPLYVGGLISVLGGIFVLDQIPGGAEEVSA